jgi:hypothetical protein
VTLEARASVPLRGNRTLVATGDTLLVLDSTGAQSASCTVHGQQVPSRLLSASPQDTAVAAFARSPLVRLNLDVAGPTTCQARWWELSPEPYAVTAVAVEADGGSVITVEQEGTRTPLRVARYNKNGTRVGASTPSPRGNQPGHLCSAVGAVASSAGVVVADATCRQLVVFDPTTLRVTARASVDGIPRGVALVAGGSRALVPVAEPTADGALGSFVLVELG